MKLYYTAQALQSLQEVIDFLSEEVPPEKVNQIRDRIVEKVNRLIPNPYLGQKEEYLAHLGLNHRRIISGHYKIIYRIEGEIIFITDVFDSRQDPSEMKP